MCFYKLLINSVLQLKRLYISRQNQGLLLLEYFNIIILVIYRLPGSSEAEKRKVRGYF